MPGCYIPGAVVAVAVFGVAALVVELVKAAAHALDSVVQGMEQLVPMAALAAKLTLLAIALTLAVAFVAWSARVVRKIQARRMAATGVPCPQAQAGTCTIDCAVKDAMAGPGGRAMLPLHVAERPAREFETAA